MTQRRASIHVLHVDDRPAFCDTVSSHLERIDSGPSFTVSAVSDARTALDRLDGSQVDCIVSGYEMPEMDGLELLRAVQSRYPELPFILFTGRGSEEVARDAFQDGATDYMQKRTGSDQYTVLAKRIRNAVSQHRPQTTSEDSGSAIEVLDNAVYVLDGEGHFTSVDDGFVDLTGYSRETVVGRHLSGIDADGTLAERFEALMTTEEVDDEPEFRAEIEPATGSPRDCRCHLTVHQVDDTGVESVVGTLQDMTHTERRRDDLQYYDGLTDLILDTSTTLMSAEPDEVDTKLRWTLENIATHVGADRCTVYSTDAGDGFVHGTQSTPRVEDIRKSHEWCGEDIDPGDQTAKRGPASQWWLDSFRRFENVRFDDLDTMPPRARGLRERFEQQGVESVVAVPLVSDWSLQGFVEFVSHDSETGWTDREVRLLRTLGDLVAHTLDRRRHERALARYKTIVETVPDGVFLLDEDIRMTQVNEAFASSLGVDVDELQGKPFLTLIEEGLVDADIVQEYLDGVDAMRSGSREKNVFEVEVDPRDDDGGRIYEAHIRLLPYDDGFRGTAGIARDVTEQHQQRAQLRRQNERLDKFASVVSHDLRNPLNVAQGFLEVGRETGESEHFDRVEDALSRIDSLVENVLSLARRGQTVGERTTVDLALTASRAWEAVDTADATLEVTNDLGTVLADEHRLREVLENLFRNSVEHGSTSERAQSDDAVEHADCDVAVTVTPLSERPGFAVTDDGPGVPPDEREAVFDHGHSTSADGTGFGLGIVRDIVEAHGWEVTLTEAADGGARFEIATESAATPVTDSDPGTPDSDGLDSDTPDLDAPGLDAPESDGHD